MAETPGIRRGLYGRRRGSTRRSNKDSAAYPLFSIGGPIERLREKPLFVPLCFILLRPRHPFRRVVDNNFAPLNRGLHLCLPFHGPIKSLFSPIACVNVAQDHPSIVRISLGIVNLFLYACEKVVILVDTARCSQLTALQIRRWIADAAALGPVLVALNTGKRASKSEASGTAVFMWINMARGESIQLCRRKYCKNTHQILQRSLRRGSAIGFEL